MRADPAARSAEGAISAAPSASVEQRSIAADAAHRAVAAAVAEAARLGLRINVAVCDASGVLTAFLRMPGAFLHSVEIAIDKAYTAAGFGFPTSAWPEAFDADAPLRTITHRPRLVAFGGGVPIREAGVLIGAIGVSGASAEQDAACAAAGIAAIGL